MLDHGSVALDGGPREVFAQGTRLRRIGVDSPRCARISNSLAAEGILEDPLPALDVASALAQIDRILRAHGVEPEPRATGAARPRVRTAAGAGEPGPAPRPAVLELSGVENVLCKSLGTDNVMNVVKATAEGLKEMQSPESVAERRGISVAKIYGWKE